MGILRSQYKDLYKPTRIQWKVIRVFWPWLSCSFKLQLFGSKKRNCPGGVFPESKPRPKRRMIRKRLTGSKHCYKRESFSNDHFFVSAFLLEGFKATRKIFNHQVIHHLKGSRFLNNQYFMESIRDPGVPHVRNLNQKFHVPKPNSMWKNGRLTGGRVDSPRLFPWGTNQPYRWVVCVIVALRLCGPGGLSLLPGSVQRFLTGLEVVKIAEDLEFFYRNPKFLWFILLGFSWKKGGGVFFCEKIKWSSQSEGK